MSRRLPLFFRLFAALMKKYREDIERVDARMQEAAEAFDRGDIDRLTALADMTSTVTPKGSIRDLRGKILWLLKDRNQSLTSAHIADALYSPAFGMSKDLFRRRVIVTTSLMNRKLGLSIPRRMEGNEIYWCAPEEPHDVDGMDELFQVDAHEPHETTKAALVERP